MPSSQSAKVATIAEQPAESESLRLFVANALAERSSLLVKWIIDSGASSPMSSQRNWFHMYRDISPPKKVWLGDERYILALFGQRTTCLTSAEISSPYLI